jgi:hypothetical protein
MKNRLEIVLAVATAMVMLLILGLARFVGASQYLE